jgi:hypothetical protein
MRRLVFSLATFALTAMSASFAQAACSPYPYTLTNGTTADASQVMANFNCAASLGGPTFSGGIGIIDGLAGTGNQFVTLQTTDYGASNPFFFIKPDNTSSHPWAGSWNIGTWNGSSTSGSIQFQTAVASFTQSVGVGVSNPTTTFQVNGTASGTSSWQIVSDRRLKQDITPVRDGLSMLSKLHPVRFRWRPEAERSIGQSLNLPENEQQIGFVAQDVEKVVPEAVSLPTDPTVPYTLKEDNLMPVLVAAVKEQQVEIKNQQAEIIELQAEIERMKHDDEQVPAAEKRLHAKPKRLLRPS